MRLECKECHKVLNLPDAKLPVGRPFTFNCPYCKQKNTALIPEAGAEAAAPPPERPEPEEAPEGIGRHRAPSPPAGPERPEPEDEMERIAARDSANSDLQTVLSEVADDRPKAMLVHDDPEVQEILLAKLEAGGYRASAALNPRDAAKQLKFANFSLMIIQEDYCGSNLHGNLLLRSLQSLDSASRRGMLVVLISPSMVSLDDLTAFSLSIDAIINVSDLDSIDRLLVSTTARGVKFYSVYREILAENGLA